MTNLSIHLKDNQINDQSQIGKLMTDDVKTILRYLSSHPLSAMKDDSGCDVLVLPHSFKETKGEIGDSYVLNYVEDKDGNPESISTNNMVGFIGYKEADIRIHSRFSSEIGKKNEVKDYFLYYLLAKTMSINLFKWNTSSSKDNDAQVFDFLLFFFPKMLKEALSQGMYKKYVYHEYNDANIRGVVDVNRHIRLNIPANGKIAYRTREFCYDNNVTQLIRHTIEFIRRKPFGKAVLHNDPDTEGCVQQIIQATPTFVPQKRQAVINDNLRPVSHPYYTKYTALQKLCLRILRHEKLSYGSANDNKIHGLLIDAAWLWEEYVAKVLSEKGLGMKHYTRKNSPFYLFSDSNGPFQQIIPDYYDEKKNIVADAKYIPLHRSRKLDADRAAPIYYKTIMYMYRFNAHKGFLFHPCSYNDIEEMREDNEAIEVKKNNDKDVVVVTSNYHIRDMCYLHKVGLVIPDIPDKTKDDKNFKYSDFGGLLKEREDFFVDEIDEIKKTPAPL